MADAVDSRQAVGELVAGRLLISLIQANHYLARVPSQFWLDLWQCDYCLGFWVYLLTGKPRLGWYSNGLIDRVVSAAVATFVAHIVTLGLKFKYGVGAHE